MCLLRICSAFYCKLSAGLSRQAVSSGEAGCSCLPDRPSPTPPPLRRHAIHLVRAASWQWHLSYCILVRSSISAISMPWVYLSCAALGLTYWFWSSFIVMAGGLSYLRLFSLQLSLPLCQPHYLQSLCCNDHGHVISFFCSPLTSVTSSSTCWHRLVIWLSCVVRMFESSC